MIPGRWHSLAEEKRSYFWCCFSVAVSPVAYLWKGRAVLTVQTEIFAQCAWCVCVVCLRVVVCVNVFSSVRVYAPYYIDVPGTAHARDGQRLSLIVVQVHDAVLQ